MPTSRSSPPAPSRSARAVQVERPDHDIDLARALPRVLGRPRRHAPRRRRAGHRRRGAARPRAVAGAPRRLSGRRRRHASGAGGRRGAHGTEWGMPPSRLVPARALAVGLAAVLAVGACSASPDRAAAGCDELGGAAATTASAARLQHRRRRPTPTTSPASSATADPSGPAVALLGGLDVPWSIAMLPDGSSLVSVRNTGEVHHVPKPGSGGRATVAGTLPITREAGEGGLLGLAVPEDFDANPVFYAYYSTDNDNRIAAVPWRDGTLGEPQVIFDGIPMGTQPQRRPHRLRPRRLPLRRHRRGRRQLACRRTSVARRQDPAPDARGQARSRQPLRRLRHLVLRPPQRAGPRLGQPGPPVGQRVRRQHLRRAQPHQAR